MAAGLLMVSQIRPGAKLRHRMDDGSWTSSKLHSRTTLFHFYATTVIKKGDKGTPSISSSSARVLH